ncbi:MAG: LmbE family protein [Pedosphaera sp.]|nr:LmbE family protein [Pedosphaera sp.]MST00408.1 LmbE family protein [Pedosphaera sp.]
MKIALAIAAHPDDIEFGMAGTLLLLKQRGWGIHCFNLSTGNCGSMEMSPARTRAVRRLEAQAAARVLGARWHPPIADDLEILYTVPTVRRVAAVVRAVKPSIVLTHSPQDYMEDHMNTCRLAVTAAFAHGMRNFRTTPPRAPFGHDVTVYHAMPHGLRDGLRRAISPETFVNTAAVHTAKLAALACHKSQQGWLDASQGMNSYLAAMEEMSRELGRLSGKFTHAEGWRRHLHLGFSVTDSDLLAAALGKDHLKNRKYEAELKEGR